MSRVKGTEERPRLVVHRSNKNIYAQIVDDISGAVIAGASTLSAGIKESGLTSPKEKSRAVGKLIAEKAVGKKVNKVAFDRKKFKYHGNVKELAEGAREGGLDF